MADDAPFQPFFYKKRLTMRLFSHFFSKNGRRCAFSAIFFQKETDDAPFQPFFGAKVYVFWGEAKF